MVQRRPSYMIMKVKGIQNKINDSKIYVIKRGVIMKKKILTIALSGVLLISSGAITFANNHSDTGFEFYFTRSPIRTERREKQDKSASYVKVESGKNLSNGVTMKMVGGNYQDVGSSTRTFYKPGFGKIKQYTKEWNINETRLQGTRVRNNYMTVFGLWSPDSRK